MIDKKIGVGTLKDVKVLYEGDIYDLACLLLKAYDAQDEGTNRRSRHTVYGLANTYSSVVRVSPYKILKIFAQHKLPLDATVEYDQDVE
jgi:hypothetical protein